MSDHACLQTPFGRIGVTVVDDRITQIAWRDDGPEVESHHPLVREAVRQIHAWLADPRHRFDLPLAPADTSFRQRMREAMCAIAPGQTRTYGEVAAELGSSPRAVGGACRHNPMAVVVPCHRIVATGGIGGYSGDWGRGAALRHKLRLIDFERTAGA